MKILQVVRRFGPVGGMERYVWELTRELAAMGHGIQVLCEVDLNPEPLTGVTVHTLGTVRPKPRWLAHIRFSNSVERWLAEHPQSGTLIHSHERLGNHHITTFHGPPFAQIQRQPVWRRISIRAAMNLWLERREVCGEQVQIVVPNSIRIAEDLKHYYPAIVSRIADPIVPGVAACTKRPPRKVAADSGVIGFVGKEWKRKGLEMAINIVAKLAGKRPNLTFLVAGPHEESIRHLFREAPFNYRLLGETDTRELYQQFDLLLHPARQEPFGMVVTEALSAGVPAVISDVCGAATEITSANGELLSLEAPVEAWAETIHRRLNSPYTDIIYDRRWHQVSIEYEKIYKHLQI